MSRNLKIAALVVVVLFIAGVSAGLYMFTKKQADLTSVKADFVLSAENLQKEFETDEAAATAKYTGKVIETTGEVIAIIVSPQGSLTVTLQTGNDLSKVICTFIGDVDASQFELGKPATVRGECSGFLMDVLLNNCVSVHAK